jgi:hypothetical protein
MIDTAEPSDGDLVLSIAAVWRSYFDQQRASLAAVLGVWGIAPAPTPLWEAYRDSAALGVASLLAAVVGGPFAWLYAASLAAVPAWRRRPASAPSR